MNAGAHALTGAVLGLGAGRLLDVEPATAAAWSVVAAAAALLPDIDHHGSTATRSAGWLSRLAHEAVDTVGDHRGPTHSLLGVAAGAAITWALTLHPWGVGVLLAALLIPLARVADRLIPGPHWRAAVLIGAVGVGVGIGGPAAVAALGIGVAALPAVVAAGLLIHILGDQITHSGIRWLWPVGSVVRLPVSIRAGGPVERFAVVPALFLSLGYLAALAARDALVT